MENEILNPTSEPCEDDVLDFSSEDFEAECEATEEAEQVTETKKERMLRKCNEVKSRCCGTVGRIASDLRECDYNPYFKETRSYKLEVYRNATDEELIDEIEISDEKCFSARSLAIAGGVVLTLVLATKIIADKLLD